MSIENVGNLSQKTHTYAANGKYAVLIDDCITTIGTAYSSFSKNKALRYVKTGNELTALATYAFYNAENLVSADLLHVKTATTYTFTNCSKLQSINIPELTSVGTTTTYSLSGCTSLTSIYVNNSTLKSIDDGYGNPNKAVVTVNGTNLKWVCPSITQFSNTQVTSLTGYTFCGCEITSINLPNLRAATARAFNSTFRGSKLISADFPLLSGATGTYCFADCKRLQYAKFSGNITSIGNGVFENCINLSCIDFGDRIYTTIPTVTTTTFSGCSNVKVVVPDSMYQSWSTSGNWPTCINSGQIELVKKSDFDIMNDTKN